MRGREAHHAQLQPPRTRIEPPLTPLGTFPFGQPIRPLTQHDRSPKKVFVLGVYASAVHARWVDERCKPKISAVAVASEPEIFWRGSQDEAASIIAAIELPPEAGQLMPAAASLNGPSGVALDELFLNPLGYSRDDAWLCDLVPYSCMNEKQEAALKRAYDPEIRKLGLPRYDWPLLPSELADDARCAEIESELLASGAELVITLGDLPLKWFTRRYGSKARLSSYGSESDQYGRRHPFTVAGRAMQLLPLVHPRQAARLGLHSPKLASWHDEWVARNR